MKTVKIELTGESPLLMNNPASMMDEQKSTKKTARYDHKAEAEKLAYKDDKGVLYVPAAAVKGCIIGGASYVKFGKFAAKPMIAGGVHIKPEKISLGTKKYDLDIRTVVIQRARVVKARPMIENWKITFELEYDESLIPYPERDLKPIIEDAGKRIGLLDFRPQKLGSFGRFKVTKWEE